MSQGIPPQPKSTAREWVDDGVDRHDVSGMPDRTIAIRALDASVRTFNLVKLHSNEFLMFRREYESDKIILVREIPNLARRISRLEDQTQPSIRPPSYRPAQQSSHEWDEMLVKAGHQLSERVRDPRDRLDSNRAREIAQEVLSASTTAADAKAFRTWRTRAGGLVFEVAKWGAVAGVGGLIHWILALLKHGGH
jgi:hypothetical protein